MCREGLFKGFQKEPLSAGAEPGKRSKRGCLSALGSVAVENIRGISEIFLVYNEGEITQLSEKAGLEPSMVPSCNFLS